MKKILPLLIVLISFVTNAQKKKLDKVFKTDNTILEVSITKISEKEIEYRFPNETLSNSIEINKIFKIEFASGRIQIFEKIVQNVSEQSSNKSDSKELEIKSNSIAVLPIPFVNSETLATSEEMAKFAQNDVYSKLIESSSKIFPLSVQDLRITNSLLRKAGIDYKNIDETPIEDLHKILGVDHIIASKVSYVMTETSNSQTYEKEKVKLERNKIKSDDFSFSRTEQNKKFDFNVYFDLYKNNTKIYTKTRTPILTMKDSWMDSMTFLLKRCPIYNK